MKEKNTRNIQARRITRVTNIVAGIVLLLVFVWGGNMLWSRYKYTYTNDAQVTQYINPVIARIGGYIVSVHYEDNQSVKKGDTLLIIDNREYLFEAAQASASIHKEEAQIQVLTSQKQILQEEYSALKKTIVAAESRVKKQQLEYNRYKYLYDEHSATAQQLEEVESKLEIYKSQLEELQHRLEAAQEKVVDIDVQKQVIGAERKKWEAAVDRKELDVNYTVIRAQYDGIMGKRTIEKGQMINSGEVLGYIVNAETPIWVTANFKETQLRNLALNDKAIVVADAFPDEEFTGRIISISPATGSSFSLLPPDNSTGNFVKIVQRVPVRIELDSNQDERKLRSGMNVNVSVAKK